MSQITNTQSTAVAPSAAPTGNSIENLDLDTFLQLMLQELQNQDPLDPMDNSELLQQLTQIREISANDKLTDTLDSVLLGQNVTTATGLIGTEVEGLTDDGRRVTGSVQQVTINDGEPRLELAVATAAEAGDTEGALEEGTYLYEIAWEAEDTTFSVQVQTSTADFADEFNGSIRVDNLPETSTPKRIYRSDSSGGGEMRLVGTLANGSVTSFVDTLADDQRRDEALGGNRQVLQFADSVEVTLNNISTVQTLR